MLSEGSVGQAELLSELGEWSTPEALCAALNEHGGSGMWRQTFFGSAEDALGHAVRGRMAAVLAAPGGNLHMVVVEPTGQGHFLVRDPYPGVTYRVDAEWIRKYVAAGVFR
jgi:hypothetical protein